MIELTEVPAGKLFRVTITLDLVVTGGTLSQYFHGNVILFYRFKTDKSLAGGISEFDQQF